MRSLIRSTWAGVALSFVLLAALGGCNACASAGGVKRAAYDTLSTTQTVLEATQKLEIGLVCDRPTAPPAPACVPIALHHTIQAQFLEAAEYGQQITAIVRSLPAGTPTPGNVLDLALKLKTLVQKILAALPKSDKADALQAQLAGG